MNIIKKISYKNEEKKENGNIFKMRWKSNERQREKRNEEENERKIRCK